MQITIEEFSRLELRVAEVREAARVDGADKLLRLRVVLGGDEERQIVAGIARRYEPQALVGKQIILVANLAPATIRGVESQGMLLAAVGEDGEPVVATFEDPVQSGAVVR